MNILEKFESLLFCYYMFVSQTSSLCRRALHQDPDWDFSNLTELCCDYNSSKIDTDQKITLGILLLRGAFLNGSMVPMTSATVSTSL